METERKFDVNLKQLENICVKQCFAVKHENSLLSGISQTTGTLSKVWTDAWQNACLHLQRERDRHITEKPAAPKLGFSSLLRTRSWNQASHV